MKFSDIQAKSVVDLAGGKLMGTVADLLLSEQDRSIKLMEVDLPDPNTAANGYIPFFEVSGFYSYALTVESASLMKAYQSLADLQQELPDLTELMGKKVLSTRGNLLGRIVDFCYDDDNSTLLLIYVSKQDVSEKIVCYLAPGFNINHSFILIDESQCVLESSLYIANPAGKYTQEIKDIIAQSDKIYAQRKAEVAESTNAQMTSPQSEESAAAGVSAAFKTSSNTDENDNFHGALPGGFRYANYQGRPEVFSTLSPTPDGDGYVDMAGRPYVASDKFPDSDRPAVFDPSGRSPMPMNYSDSSSDVPYDEQSGYSQHQDSLWNEVGPYYDGVTDQLDGTVTGAISTPAKSKKMSKADKADNQIEEAVLSDDSSLFNEFAELYGI